MTDTPAAEAPKPLTKEEIRNWTAEDMKKAIQQGRLNEINTVLATPTPTDEEIAAAEQAAADAQAAAEAQAAADAQAAEAARVAAEAAAAAAAEEAARPKKIVVEYQATDEDGKPIGRPTHLEAYSWEEMSKKQTEAHINALRYAERVKTRKITQKQPEQAVPELTQEEIAAATADLESDDPAKKVAAIRKLNRTDLIEKQLRESAQEKENARQAAVSYAFMRNHLQDFNPCDANAKILTDYINSNNLEWTEDNLEAAFAEVNDQLAPVVKAAPAVEIPPAAPVAAPVAPAAAPVAAAPVVAAPAAPAPNVPARPVPHGGVQPGTLTAGRPVPVKPAGLTKAQIKAWTSDEMKAYMRKPGGVAEINRVLAGK